MIFYSLIFQTASLDSRKQLVCVRCSQPAKVTEEPTGEEWAECTNTTCLYQFCRSCNCSRHPGKSCNQYDLNAPSPSKRKKCDYAVGTRKSRKNLRRLLWSIIKIIVLILYQCFYYVFVNYIPLPENYCMCI